MLMIYTGLLLWIAVHLFPSVAPESKRSIVARLGDNAYQGLFALLVFTGLLLIIFGWRSSTPELLYAPYPGLRHPLMLLAAIGILLFVASSFPSRIKRLIRHPQLTGVFLWGTAHLLLNGDSRSVTVFGALVVWSIISMLTINKREGPCVKSEATQGWWLEGVIIVVGLFVSALIVSFHQYLSGVALIT